LVDKILRGRNPPIFGSAANQVDLVVNLIVAMEVPLTLLAAAPTR
jgi:hypothetical protein